VQEDRGEGEVRSWQIQVWTKHDGRSLELRDLREQEGPLKCGTGAPEGPLKLRDLREQEGPLDLRDCASRKIKWGCALGWRLRCCRRAGDPEALGVTRDQDRYASRGQEAMREQGDQCGRSTGAEARLEVRLGDALAGRDRDAPKGIAVRQVIGCAKAFVGRSGISADSRVLCALHGSRQGDGSNAQTET